MLLAGWGDMCFMQLIIRRAAKLLKSSDTQISLLYGIKQKGGIYLKFFIYPEASLRVVFKSQGTFHLHILLLIKGYGYK